MALPLIGGLLSSVGDIAGTWVKGKMKEKKALTEIKVAKAKAEATVYEKQATGELDMEKSLTEQMGGSWKDEAWTICFIALIVCAFIPNLQPSAKLNSKQKLLKQINQQLHMNIKIIKLWNLKPKLIR